MFDILWNFTHTHSHISSYPQLDDNGESRMNVWKSVWLVCRRTIELEHNFKIKTNLFKWLVFEFCVEPKNFLPFHLFLLFKNVWRCKEREKNEEEEEEEWGKIHNRFKIFRNFWDPKEKNSFQGMKTLETFHDSRKFSNWLKFY